MIIYFFTISIFIENRLLSIGGLEGRERLSSVEVTQVEKNQSCLVDPFPYALSYHSATIIPTGILVCGGYSTTYEETEQRCYEYKKTTGSWEPFPSMTTKRYDFDMIFLNQAVWAIGGWGGSKSTTTLDKYEMHTNVWTKHSISFNYYWRKTKSIGK